MISSLWQLVLVSEYLGWDSYEHDYFGIDGMDVFAEDEAKKKLKQMTKDELIQAIRQCFRCISHT